MSAQFIEVQYKNGRKRLLNTDHIIDVADDKEKSGFVRITMTEGSCKDDRIHVVHVVKGNLCRFKGIVGAAELHA